MSILVRRSRLEVGSDSVQFPTVSGFNLNRQELEFPRDFRGDLNLLFVPFLQPQQFVVNTWIPLADELEAIFPELAYYELPTIDTLPALSRTFINEGMRAGIPNAKARERTITLYVDTARFMRATRDSHEERCSHPAGRSPGRHSVAHDRQLRRG